MKIDLHGLSRSEKILLFLYEFGEGGRTKIRYEDIVVGLFKKYPHEFQLKGYTDYPDSGDLIHKPLYDFKKKGYVNAENKIFSLTERGVEFARQLSGKERKSEDSKDRLSRSVATEVSRVKSLEGLLFFIDGKKEQLSDNDFYNYLGVTVRTQKNSFIGRLETMNATIEELKRHSDDALYKSIVGYHDFLISRYGNIIDYFTTKN
jgi:hypothetical protein